MQQQKNKSSEGNNKSCQVLVLAICKNTQYYPDCLSYPSRIASLSRFWQKNYIAGCKCNRHLNQSPYLLPHIKIIAPKKRNCRLSGMVAFIDNQWVGFLVVFRTVDYKSPPRRGVTLFLRDGVGSSLSLHVVDTVRTHPSAPLRMTFPASCLGTPPRRGLPTFCKTTNR